MLNIEDPELLQLEFDHTDQPRILDKVACHPLLDLPFRAFFLLAVSASIVGLVVWLAYLNGYFVFEHKAITVITWHLHEMIFGFAATVAVGFLLTAVQTWTQKPSIKGLPLLAIIMLWLLVRVSLLLSLSTSLSGYSSLFIYSAVIFQTLWWLSLISIFAQLVSSTHNRRNYLFIPLLSALMLLNIGILSFDMIGHHNITLHLARTSILLFGLLMGILGGRVIPFFTSSGAKIPAIVSPSWLTTLLICVSLIGVIIFFIGLFIDLPFTPASLLISAGILHLVRLSFYKSTTTILIPLLWSLHLAYFSLGIGLILLGLSFLSVNIVFSDALHVITISAMGLMIFSMMSRVALGHTGRALAPHKLVSVIFFCIFLAAILRVTLSIFELSLIAWNSSAALWILASILFIKIYFPVLSQPKQVTKFNR